ncbi:hypothetical protein Nepgr_010691 [Nepenthes gracilis]|uniref:Uncharacterized protein n=1 Tax=Nepenthes gracilis TaxID=150966 RepID=A0AAD3XLN3_NEPGR|nr:hypothetical protein Nepgr_010691 [Nepenthes gracilis]
MMCALAAMAPEEAGKRRESSTEEIKGRQRRTREINGGKVEEERERRKARGKANVERLRGQTRKTERRGKSQIEEE